jgi:uncharacterized protein (TIGR02588 family)
MAPVDQDSSSSSSRSGGSPRRHRWLEITAALVGVTLALVTLGVLVWDGLQGVGPPDVAIEVVEIVPGQGGYLVEVDADNRGNRTATDLQFEGVLSDHGREVETAEGTIDYVPSRSRRRGGLVFEHDPRGLELEIHVRGFGLP